MTSTTLFPGYSSYRPLKRVRRHSSLALGDGQIRDPGNEVAKSTRLFVWGLTPPVGGGGGGNSSLLLCRKLVCIMAIIYDSFSKRESGKLAFNTLDHSGIPETKEKTLRKNLMQGKVTEKKNAQKKWRKNLLQCELHCRAYSHLNYSFNFLILVESPFICRFPHN